MIIRNKFLVLAALIAVLLGFYLLWHFSPIAKYTEIDAMIKQIDQIENYPATPIIFMLIYLLAGLTLFPMTVLNIALVIVFGPWIGFCYAYLGNVLSALFTFFIVRVVGHKAFHNISGERIRYVSQLIAKKGIISVIFLRITPLSFALLSMIAGISHIKSKDYFWGNLIGIIPGIAIVCFFAGKTKEILQQPNLQDLFILFLGGICIIFLWKQLYKTLKKSAGEDQK